MNFLSNNKIFKTFLIFSIFRAIYGLLILLTAYFINTELTNGFTFSIIFFLISMYISRLLFKKIKKKFNL